MTKKGTTNVVLHLEGDGAFSFLKDEGVTIRFAHPHDDELHIAILPSGTTSGMPSIAFAQKLGDGSWAILQTTGKAFMVVAHAMIAKLDAAIEERLRLELGDKRYEEYKRNKKGEN